MRKKQPSSQPESGSKLTCPNHKLAKALNPHIAKVAQYNSEREDKKSEEIANRLATAVTNNSHEDAN